MYKVYLKPGKEESLKRFHPWVFSGAIAHFDGEPEEGEVVEIYYIQERVHSQRTFPNRQHCRPCTQLLPGRGYRCRLLETQTSIAYDMRRSIGIAGNPTNNTYRLVHGRGRQPAGARD